MISMPSFVPIDFDPFGDVREIEKITLTNEPQREIWLACIIGGEEASLSYNESVSLKISGQLNFNALKKAVNDLILRHEALRSTISPNGETLIVYRNFPIDFDLEDISNLNLIQQQDKLKSFIRKAIDTTLDLYEGPLFKAFLHKLSDTEHFFTIIKHHAIGDGWSTGIILEDLSKMYNAYRNGETPFLNKPAQMSDYATAQIKFKRSKAYKETEDFWLNLYKDEIPVLDLPTDFPRPSPRTYKGNRIDYPLPKEFINQIKTVGAKAGCSLVTTLLAAFEVFLYQKTNQKDIVVGLPASGQAASELYDLVGHCVNLLPLKTNINSEKSFTDYLKKRKGEVLDAYEHQRLTFGELIKKLYIPRDTSRIPLVPVIFNIDMGMDNAVAFDGLDFKLISNPRAYENFEIFLNATGSKDGLILEWSYNVGLFTSETIEKFNSDFNSILKKICLNPDVSISELTGRENIFIEPAEEVFVAANETINNLIAETVKNYSGKTAVSFNEAKLSYRQLDEKVNQFASFLLEKGINKGDILALSLERSAEMLISLLGILKIGAVYLPLDPEYPLDRIEFMLEDSSAKLLLVSKEYKNRYKSNSEELVIDEIWSELQSYPTQFQPKDIKGTDLAYILYTSGSTGKPKGVKITHRNLANFLISMRTSPGIKDSDRLLAITTISFDIAGLELYLPLISGAELILADTDSTKDGRILLNILEEKQISIMQATPSTWQMLLDSGWNKKFKLKILSGGEALPKDLALKLIDLSDELWNMYGPTETTIWSTIKRIKAEDKVLTIGWPINNTKVYVVNDNGKVLPNNEIGEIYIGGDGVAEGYLNRPELTAEKFVADSINQKNNARLYRTGDLGKILENGEIQCLGRIDHQVKIRGYRIELGEIETIVSKQRGVKQAVVLAREDVPMDKRLVAYLTLDNETEISENSPVFENQILISKEIKRNWKDNLSELLPAYMVPEDFIVLKSFPLTPNAKIDRKALPKPEQRKIEIKTTDRIELTKNEKTVTDIWTEALGLEHVNVEDDFFELGGHSLLAVKVMVAIEEKTGKRLPLATLFNNSTIEKLAKQISDDEPSVKWDTLVPIKTTGTKTPIFLIHGGGLNILLFRTISSYFDKEQPVYGLQALGLSHETNIPRTMEEIAKRYIDEILTVHPEGPYCIAGYSLGGFIGFEIAKQLKEMGKEIKLLGLMDTYAGNNEEIESKLNHTFKKIKRQFNKIPFFIKSFIKQPKEAFEYQLIVSKKRLDKLKSADLINTKDILTDYELQIYKNYDFAHNNYILKPIDVKITLFRVSKRLYFLDDLISLGWSKFAKKGVVVKEIPGDHKTFLYPPNDKLFADILQQTLNDL